VATGGVLALVIDPLAATGDEYRVGFETAGDTTTWFLQNLTQNRRVLDRQPIVPESFTIVEGGVLLYMFKPPDGLKREDQFTTGDTSQWGWRVTSGSRLVTWVNASDLSLEGFRGAAGWTSPYSLFQGGTMAVPPYRLKNLEIRFAAADTSGAFQSQDPNASYAYRYGRRFNEPPARPEFAPFIINPSAGYAYQDYTLSMPLAVYDIDSSPPRRLAVGFLENNVAGGSVNGRYWPPTSETNNVTSSGPREWLFIFDADYDAAAPNPLLHVDLLAAQDASVMYMATWNRFARSWTSENAMTLHPHKPFTPQDRYDYRTLAPEKNTRATEGIC